jgi:prophage regulatory protein
VNTASTSAILRLKQVQELTGLPRSSIYALMQRQEFPAQIKLSQKSVGWARDEIQQWIDLRRRERDERVGARPA